MIGRDTAILARIAISRMVVTIGVIVLSGAAASSHAQAISDLSQAGRANEITTKEGSALSNNQQTTDLELPASRIIATLQADPEVLVEVKSFLADLSQQKGTPAQLDTVTDEELYKRITSDSDLRDQIAYFLRARGYLKEEDIQPGLQDEMERRLASAYQEPRYGPTVERPFPVDDDWMSAMSGRERGYRPMDPREWAAGYPEAADARNPPRQLQEKREQNVTDDPQGLHQPAPYNLLSLRDLYTQIPESREHLKRFGSEVFSRRSSPLLPGISSSAGAGQSLDMPLGPDYVLGAGDELAIAIWGGVSQTVTRAIDREGRVMLPEAGQVQVAGLTLERAEDLIHNALGAQFRNAHVTVTVARLRTIRVYVVGDVQRPGAYEINSLASPLTALIAAGGPTAIGSLRVVRHYREQRLVDEIDLYDFLLHGVRGALDRLESGDTLLIPPVGRQVAVYGAVKRPGIYELRDEKMLDAVLADAGGVTVAAALGHITVDRIVANQRREELTLGEDAAEDPGGTFPVIASFEVKDGDRVHVATVLPYSERSVYLQGHFARTGRVAYSEDLHLSGVIRSYQDLLPEPADRGEIVRLVAPDLHPETIEFNVPEVLLGNADLALQPFDTIRTFGRYDRDPPTVSVQGEVLRPGSYPLFAGMTAAQLVRAAGGFKRDAFLQNADLTTYGVANGTEVKVERRDLPIGDAVLKHDRDADVQLKPGDVLTIHQLTGWSDIGASITIQGEVEHPGSYGFKQGERLSDVLSRAGGFRSTAYPEGAVLTRSEVAALEEKSREELIRQIETSSAAARLSPGVSGGDQSGTLRLIQEQQERVLSQLRSQPASGRLVIRINGSIKSWAGTAADIEVRNGDVLRIPKRPGFVLVTGQVYNASAITFSPGKSAGWYLERAGGATGIANRKEIFVIRANGTVVGRQSEFWLESGVLATKLHPGDVIVVPQKIVGASLIWRNLLGTAQIAASIAIAASVAGL